MGNEMMRQHCSQYLERGGDKALYIEQMYVNYHAQLFEYAARLEETNISEIRVLPQGIIVTVRDCGLQFLMPEHDRRSVAAEILNFGDYENRERAMILKLIPDGATVLDVGANIGWYSIVIASKICDVTVHAFEPIPSTFSVLQQNLALNGLSNVRANVMGLADAAGIIPLYYYPEGTGNASVANLSGRSSVEMVDCKVVQLDSYVNDCGITVDFIKCDVEGAEQMVFKGGSKTMTRDHPAVFVEILRKWSRKVGHNYSETFAYFQNLGYRAFTVGQNNLVPFGRMTDDTKDTNFFFLHADKHADEIAVLAG